MKGIWVQATATITTNSDGDATVYIGGKFSGRLFAIKYVPGTLDTGADLVFTGETSEVPVLTVTNAGTSTAWWVPVAVTHKVADASAGSSEVPIYLFRERLKLVVAQGGSVASGTVTAYFWEQDSGIVN